MSRPWPLVPLGEVLKPVGRPETVDPEKTYRVLGAHWYAKGLYVKDRLPGSEIRADKVYRVMRGDFVYNRLFAWKGSFAVASKEHDGCYVSNEFPCFVLNQDLVDGNYLWRYFSRSSAWDEALDLSSGGTPTSRNRLKEEKFLAIKIPLPPLSEQRRIVARIDNLAVKIETARILKQQALRGVEHLLVVMAHRPDLDEPAKRKQGWTEVRLSDVIQKVEDPHLVEGDASYPNLGVYSFGRGVFKKPNIEGFSTSATTLYRVRTGQFIYSRLFAFEGAYGMVPEDFDGYFVSNEYPTFACNGQIKAEFLYAYFKSPNVWMKVAEGSKGIGHRRQRVQPDRILAHRLMLPPLESQEKIASVLRKTDAAKEAHAETATELDAMLPSILDKAFKGDLL